MLSLTETFMSAQFCHRQRHSCQCTGQFECNHGTCISSLLAIAWYHLKHSLQRPASPSLRCGIFLLSATYFKKDTAASHPPSFMNGDVAPVSGIKEPKAEEGGVCAAELGVELAAEAAAAAAQAAAAEAAEAEAAAAAAAEEGFGERVAPCPE